MDVIPIGTKVSIVERVDSKSVKFYGYVRKIVIEESIKYFVQFHPKMDWVECATIDLEVED